MQKDLPLLPGAIHDPGIKLQLHNFEAFSMSMRKMFHIFYNVNQKDYKGTIHLASIHLASTKLALFT